MRTKKFGRLLCLVKSKRSRDKRSYTYLKKAGCIVKDFV